MFSPPITWYSLVALLDSTVSRAVQLGLLVSMLSLFTLESAAQAGASAPSKGTALVRVQETTKLFEFKDHMVSYPSSCSDGTIVFSRGRTDWSGKMSLWQLPADGSEAKPLFAEELPSDATRAVCSPDSRSVVFRLGPNRKGGFDTPGQVWVLDRASGEIHVISDGSKGSNFYSVWSPQGNWLLVQRFQREKDAGDADLLRVWLDGREDPLISWTTWEGPGGFSPDGRRVLFVSYADGDEVLRMWEMDVEDGEASAKLLSLQNAFFPMWSPDGSWISFASDRDGFRAVYLQSADGTTVIRVSEPIESWAHPTWTADGRRLITNWSEPGELVSLDVSAVIEEFQDRERD